MAKPKPEDKPNDFNYVLSQQIKRGLRNKEYNLDKAIEEAVEKDRN